MMTSPSFPSPPVRRTQRKMQGTIVALPCVRRICVPHRRSAQPSTRSAFVAAEFPLVAAICLIAFPSSQLPAHHFMQK
ncbi:hypothetical protein AXF42_Ash001656 [Apostasia shenzhenica]|uniref:Uncharacterized protein n=1 Tax=Apostasia shenzhenica TaxID=1088818 RepID=A0A2I0AAY8_9ASPA|nr:hypothetical protein AXF42_Ash001656 [Apostasia shenzhenica]